MPNEVKKILEEIAVSEEIEILDYSPLAGGDINRVFLLKTSSGYMVVKINEVNKFPGMFEAEKTGLETLKNSKTVDVPKVYSCGNVQDTAYLLLEYKSEGKQHPKFWNLFAEELAALHQTTNEYFGFSSSNYIGSLPQYNEKAASAGEFYIHQRLKPQLKMALESGFSFENLEVVFKNISEEIPEEKPSLIHGDLWAGNYLVNREGKPCLIDPAVCYASREMDLAMMKLFGGFPEKLFSEYDELFPLQPGFKKRVPLWQLYYLLVHLNIFGGGYLPSIKNILKMYS